MAETRKVKIKGMNCQHCVKSVTEALGRIEGVTNINVDLGSGYAQFDEELPVDTKILKDAISRIGFEVEGGKQ